MFSSVQATKIQCAIVSKDSSTKVSAEVAAVCEILVIPVGTDSSTSKCC